jgi:hypothetical protein
MIINIKKMNVWLEEFIIIMVFIMMLFFISFCMIIFCYLICNICNKQDISSDKEIIEVFIVKN